MSTGAVGFAGAFEFFNVESGVVFGVSAGLLLGSGINTRLTVFFGSAAAGLAVFAGACAAFGAAAFGSVFVPFAVAVDSSPSPFAVFSAAAS